MAELSPATMPKLLMWILKRSNPDKKPQKKIPVYPGFFFVLKRSNLKR
jgi:hypothetical protein